MLCPACAWDDAEVDLGLTEYGGGGGEDDVAGEGEFTATTELLCAVLVLMGVA